MFPPQLGLMGSGPVSGPTSPPAPAPTSNEPKQVEILDAMLQLASLYRAVEPDPQDKLTMERASTLLQQLLAKDQADRQQATGPGLAASPLAGGL